MGEHVGHVRRRSGGKGEAVKQKRVEKRGNRGEIETPSLSAD